MLRWQAPAPIMADSSTILLVDDEEAVRKLLAFPLERDGYVVVQAADGEEALRCFDDNAVDLVVLDIMLPKLDGLEVCRRLRATSSVPIIMLTARDDELDKVIGLELGADDYVTKPFSIREFRSRVRALLRRARRARVIRTRWRVEERIEPGRARRRQRTAHGGRASGTRWLPSPYVEFRAAADRSHPSLAVCGTAGGCCWSRSGGAPTFAIRGRSSCMCATCGRNSSLTHTAPSSS